MADVRTTTLPDAQTAPEAPPSPTHVVIRRDQGTREYVEAFGVDAVVIGDQYPHAANVAPISSP